MLKAEKDPIASYVADLLSTYQRLSHDLSIPQIDQELYTDLFMTPLKAQESSDGQAARPSSAAVGRLTSAKFPSSIPTDGQAEVLVTLGGAELIVSALRTHERQTVLVMETIALREEVVHQLWACCGAYDPAASQLEEAQFTVLRLLQEHQLATLLTIEAVVEWRGRLSRSYPFLLRTGENYLVNVMLDAAALEATSLVRTLAGVRLRTDPLCVSIDLDRLLHRLQTRRRSRLITTGALWNVGLQPLELRPTTATQRPNHWHTRRTTSRSRNASGVSIRAASLAAAPLPPPRPLQREAGMPDGAPPDFVTEVRRISAALEQSQQSGASFSAVRSGKSIHSATGNRSSLPRVSVSAKSAGNAEEHAKRRRLQAAAKVLTKETGRERKVVEELYALAYETQRFVPLLEIPQLFVRGVARCGSCSGSNGDDESWPLEREQWLQIVVRESRVNRVVCMATARDALREADLLPAWQRRMRQRISASSSMVSRSEPHATKTPPHDSLTPPSAVLTPYESATGVALGIGLNGGGLATPHAANVFSPDDSFSSDFESDSSKTPAASSIHAPPNAVPSHSSRASTPPAVEVVTAEGNTRSAPRFAAPRTVLPGVTAAHSRTSSTSATSSSSDSDSSDASAYRLSLDELREQLLAEHRLTSRSQSNA